MSLALIRFVNSLLDPLQKRDKSLPLSVLAKGAGLPTAFVEVRHWGTHERDLPSVEVLRDLGVRALEWLWRNYWHKGQVEGVGEEDVLVLWRGGDVSEEQVVEAFRKDGRQWSERLVEELALDEDFSASKKVWDPLLLTLSTCISDFTETLIDYIVKTLVSIPQCNVCERRFYLRGRFTSKWQESASTSEYSNILDDAFTQH